MKEQNTSSEPASTVCYEAIELQVRLRIQGWLQDLLVAEVTESLSRAKSQRRQEEAVSGYRNGYGKPRRIALTAGTVPVRRPRMRNLAERFESRVLPLFKRHAKEHTREALGQPSLPVLTTTRSDGHADYAIASTGSDVGWIRSRCLLYASFALSMNVCKGVLP
jgi:hypothetical protein